MHMSSTLL